MAGIIAVDMRRLGLKQGEAEVTYNGKHIVSYPIELTKEGEYGHEEGNFKFEYGFPYPGQHYIDETVKNFPKLLIKEALLSGEQVARG